MKSKPVSKTNPYLKRQAESGRFVTNVASSTAVETKQSVAAVAKRLVTLRASKSSTRP